MFLSVEPIVANHYLVSQGMGLMVIPAELVGEYKKLLIAYYEVGDDAIKQFLMKKCLTRLK